MTAVSLPQHIGRYRVVGLAGKGGFATVYEGFDDRLDARVAIKVLAEKWAHEPEIRRRFRNEAVLMRRLGTGSSARHLVEVFDIDETENGQLFFVMGWADRGTLAQRAKNRAWPLGDVMRVVDALAASLGHLHAGGILHRDIKPSNLLIRSNGSPENSEHLLSDGERLVLADLGLAKDTVDDTSVLSMAGGTPRFMAPERHVAEVSIDHRVDIYSATRVVEDLSKGRRGSGRVPPAVQAALHRGLATNPDERPNSMEEWAEMFAEVLLVDDPTVLAGEPPATVPTAANGPVVAAVVPPRIAPARSSSSAPPPSAPPPSATPPAVAARPAETPPPVASAPASARTPPPQAIHTAPAAETPEPAASTPAPPLEVSMSAPRMAPAAEPGLNPTLDLQSGTNQSVEKGRSQAPLLMAGVIAIIVAVAAGFLFLRGDNGSIIGPSEIQSGESARYSVDGSSGPVTWIDPAGQPIVADSLEVTGRLPGQLTFSASVDGELFSRTVSVTTSPLGPKIEGPGSVRVGESATWVAQVPAGQTFLWKHPTQGLVSSEEITILAQDADFTIGLIATDAAGIERGDQISVITEN